MLVLGMFTFTSNSATAQGNAPTWKAGDHWEYAGEGFYNNESYSAVLNLRVLGTESVAVGSGSNETYHCVFDGKITYGVLVVNQTGDTYLRTSDLAVVRASNSRISIYGSTSWDYRFDPPLEQFRFPLHDGQWWRQYVRDTTFGWTYFWSFNVSGPENVSVPAGTFSAFAVNGSEQPGVLSRDYYSDAVGFLVRTRGLFLGTPEPVDMELKSYGHQKDEPIGAIVAVLVVTAIIVVALIAFIIVRSRRSARMNPPSK